MHHVHATNVLLLTHQVHAANGLPMAHTHPGLTTLCWVQEEEETPEGQQGGSLAFTPEPNQVEGERGGASARSGYSSLSSAHGPLPPLSASPRCFAALPVDGLASCQGFSLPLGIVGEGGGRERGHLCAFRVQQPLQHSWAPAALVSLSQALHSMVCGNAAPTSESAQDAARGGGVQDDAGHAGDRAQLPDAHGFPVWGGAPRP